ncbi:hypothetical protein CRG98_011141 [Punica granatum]|uniref:DUF7745 domain-containing protein n=1 Tax=Punica granatum TaxID=22663 RepID=A0A2I0KIV8_PUNGR|nr:hypothetical protein CRG98_011141 [Punica granatum]
MDRPAPGLKLKAITSPRQEIMPIWRTLRPVDRSFVQGIIGDVVMLTETPMDWIFLRTAAEFWDPQYAVFNFQGTELAPTIEEYTALMQRPTPTTQGIFVPNPFAVIRSQLSTLLGIPVQERDACHGFLLLIFGTLSFPYAPNLIDGAIAQVVHQAVGGHSYVEALLAETIRSLDYVREVRHGRMRGFSEWRHFSRELTPARFQWVARWSPGGPMITGSPGIVGVPLLSHLGSTLIFLRRVIRQLGDLQDISAEADRLPSHVQWADSASTAPARFLQIQEIHRQRDASTIQRLYFPEHPTDEERALSATLAYVAQFYALELTSPRRPQTVPILQATPTAAPEAESSTQAAMRAELHSIREERDRLRCELDNQIGVPEEINPPASVHSQASIAQPAPPPSPTGAPPAHPGAPSAYLPPSTSVTTPPSHSGILAPPPVYAPPPLPTQLPPQDATRVTVLEGNVAMLQGTIDLMAANMAEMMALLRGLNRASSNSTPPLAHGSTVDPTPWEPPTLAPGDDIAPAPTTPAHVSTVHTADLFQPQPTVPAVAPLPSMTVYVLAPTVFAPPPQSVPIPATVYTAPPPTVLPTSNVPAPTPVQSTETFPFPTLQSHGGLPYQFLPALNIPPPEPCTPSHWIP